MLVGTLVTTTSKQVQAQQRLLPADLTAQGSAGIAARQWHTALNPAAPAGIQGWSVGFVVAQRYRMTDLNEIQATAGWGSKRQSWTLNVQSMGSEAYQSAVAGLGWAGLIHVGTQRPLQVGLVLERWRRSIAGYGATARWDVAAGVLAPISERLHLGLGAQHLNQPTWTSHPADKMQPALHAGLSFQTRPDIKLFIDLYTGQHTAYASRGGLLWTPTTSVHLRLGVDPTLRAISTGFTVAVQHLRADVAITRQAPLGYTPVVSLRWEATR